MNEAHMNEAGSGEGPRKGQLWKRVLLVAVPMVLAAVLAAVLYVVFWGMPLSGAPGPKDVQSVTVKFGEEPGSGTEYTDPGKIESACGLLGSMNYEPFATADEEDEVFVMITYNMKDGSRKVAAVNSETVWWQGKILKLKQGDKAVSIAEGLFPQD